MVPWNREWLSLLFDSRWIRRTSMWGKWESHPPSQEATGSCPWRNAGVLRSLGEGGLELRRVTPCWRCHGLLPVGLYLLIRPDTLCWGLPALDTQ
jgi:hypothetical protein